MMDLVNVEKILKYNFKNKELLELALTHSSYTTGDEGSNERLEHIGDEVIKFLVTDILFDLYPDARPEDLHDKRVEATKNKNADAIAFIIEKELDKSLRLGKSQKNSYGVTDKMRADLFESLFGAMYKDGCRMRSLKSKLKKYLKLGQEKNK